MYNTYVICIVFSAVEFEKKERTRGYLKKNQCYEEYERKNKLL